jgi:GxxExxY protein
MIFLGGESPATLDFRIVAAAPTSLARISTLKYGGLSGRILRVFYDVYNELGHGFLESVYRDAMAMALAQAELRVQREIHIPVRFRGAVIGEYRADLVVENVILLELKASRALEAEHEAQIMHYLRATEIEVGMLLNFGNRPEFRRFLYDNDRKKSRGIPPESAQNP